VGFAITVTVNAGLPNRRPNGQKVAYDYNMAISDWDYPKECHGVDLGGNLRPCQLGPAKFTGTLFLGDSFAMQIYSRFAETAKRNPGESFTFLTSPGCPPITGVRRVPDSWRPPITALWFATEGARALAPRSGRPLGAFCRRSRRLRRF
jgi:hypothetical protein